MKKSFIVSLVSLFSFFVLTTVADAQTAITASQKAETGIRTLNSLIEVFTSTIVKSLGTLLMAAAVVAFFYGIVEYIWGQREGKVDKVTAGRQFMIWGLIALFVMFSVYGIIKFGQNIFFNGENITNITIPEINFIRGSGLGPSGAAPAGANTSATNPLGTSGSNPSSWVNSLGNSSAGSGNTYGATLIQESAGWKYYSDGTAIGPDGTYYVNGQSVNSQNVNSAATDAVQSGGAGGGVASDCSNASAGDICDAGYSMTGTCQLNDSGTLECSSN